MKVCVLASGSKGNCTYIENDNYKIIIDCGITYRNAFLKAESVGIDLSNLDAIFITHEHGDHAKYLYQFYYRTKALIYIGKPTLNKLLKTNLNLKKVPEILILDPDFTYKICDFEIIPIELVHDVFCLGYFIKHNNKTILYATDTGFFPNRYLELLQMANLLIIEANHDIEMLRESERPNYLINRVLSENGHMSNLSCYHLLSRNINANNSHIILAHISEDCNSEDIITTEIIDKLYSELNYIGEIHIAKQRISSRVIKL